MNIPNRSLRNVLRAIHLAVAGLVGVYIYSPLGDLEWFGILVKVSVMPVILISGLSMWQMPALTKMFKRRLPSIQNQAQ